MASGKATPVVGSGAVAAGTGEGQNISICRLPTSAKEQPYDETADAYSCAMLIWEMAAGRRPFEGYDEYLYTRNVVKADVRPSVPEWWPAEFSEIVQSCWDPVPSKRMRLAEAATRFSQMLEAFENGTAAEPVPPPVPCARCVIS